MSLLPQLQNGYYDDTGNWQRTKFCFVQCQHCTCGPPGGLYYNTAHDKRLKEKKDADSKSDS